MTAITRTFTRCLPVAAAFALVACSSAPTQAPAPKPAPQPKTTAPAKPEPAPQPKLRAQHPIHYVVKKGDTLWDIASHFLKSPWLWPDIWYVNPQIRNPHLIYPGDVIELRWVNGKPQLTLKGAGSEANANPHNLKVVHVHPKVRRTQLEEAIPTIPVDDIRAFLTRSTVVSAQTLKDAPYVVATGDGRLLAGHHRQVYVRGVQKTDGDKWSVVRKGDPLIDPQTGDLLGYQGIYVGAGSIARWGDPATFDVTDSERGVRAGDRLMKTPSDDVQVNFYPHAPKDTVNGVIMSVIGGVSQVGQYNVVIINRGRDAGLDRGAVLAIYQRGRSVKDPYLNESVTLPDERAGLLMVFRTFDKISYGLVLELKKEAHVLDRVTNP